MRRFPWIRPLAGDYAYNFTQVAGLYAGNPRRAGGLARCRAPRAAASARSRAAGRGARRRSRRTATRRPKSRAAAARLADPDAVAVVTGQQAGVFGGPMYTLLKALTALQLARRTEREQNVPAVAIFWVEAEDHDWEEVGAVRCSTPSSSRAP